MKATNVEEKSLYEWNARNQITLWGLNTTEIVSLFLLDKIKLYLTFRRLRYLKKNRKYTVFFFKKLDFIFLKI